MTDLELGFTARNAVEWDRIQMAVDAYLGVEVPRTTSVVPGRSNGCSPLRD